MRFLPEVQLRTSVILLLAGTLLATFVMVGSGILTVMVYHISGQNQAHVSRTATDMSARIESFLSEVESRVVLIAKLYRHLPDEELTAILESARMPSLDAIYSINSAGKLAALSIANMSDARRKELLGIDLSGYRAFLGLAENRQGLQWSDKHTSAVTGIVTVGLAVPIDDGARLIIAELPLDTLLKISDISREADSLEYWIIDSRGEIVADTNPTEFGATNLYNLPIVRAGFSGTPLPETMSFGGTTYHVSASYSKALGWLIVSRIPARLQNPRLREVVTVVLVTVIGSILVGLFLAPLWAQGIVRPIRETALRAHQIANGTMLKIWPRGGIVELNQLSSDLQAMSDAIIHREEDLRQLNEDLENRVVKRTNELTRSNRKLEKALSTVELAKDELIQSEKLAALGRLVAGMAHELNTPVGNGRMAVSTLALKLEHFKTSLEDGLRRSELTAFLNAVETGSKIAEQNLIRAGDLVRGFKEVAADQTAARRRKFDLKKVVDENLLTLSPMLKPLAIKIEIEIPDDLLFDSYPGELGQALTNLIVNAATHAFDKQTGTITISAALSGPGYAIIRVQDDGVGMAKTVVKRAFDPFFTTAMGQGGTGLGLFITFNAITNVLGGTITLHSEPGEGALFTIRIPLVATTEVKPAASL
ncbi:MAG: histidine kinase [Rhodospirillales bacterium]|nr:histidine kinase [Rhodospirillales bacterium]